MSLTVMEHLPAHLWDLREHQHHLPLLCPVTSSDRRPAANDVIPHLYLVGG